MRFRASWLASSLGKRSQALLRATAIISNGSFVEFICDHSDVLSVGSLEVLSQFSVSLLRLMADQDHQARAAPKLNIVALNHALGLFDCLSIVRAFHRLIANEMAVFAYRVCLIVHHETL
jgi:hypothetical protein